MELNENHIIDFIDGTLDKSLHHEVADAIDRDDRWKETYASYKLIKEATRFDQESDLKDKFKVWSKEKGEPVEDKPAREARSFSIRKLVALAAALIAILAVIFTIMPASKSGEQLFAAYYTEPIPDITRSSQSMQLSQEYGIALESYANEKYELAISAFMDMNENDDRFQESRLLLLDAHIQSNQIDKAIELSERLLNTEGLEDTTRQKVEWTALLLYIRTENVEMMDKLITRISDQKRHLYLHRLLELRREL